MRDRSTGKRVGATRRGLLLVLTMALGTALIACGGDDDSESSAPVDAGSGGGSGSLDDLVAAAEDEGTLTWYTAIPAAVAQSAADGFREEYGIDVEFLELSSSQLFQRYASESEAGSATADVVTSGAAATFIEEAVTNEWVTPLSEGDVPNYESYPEEFKSENAATVTIYPWVMAYNSDSLGDEDPPESFEDFADPRYEGALNIPDVAASDAYVQLWLVAEEEFGTETLEAIADNDPAYFESGGPAIQALAAGDGMVMGPTTGGTAQGVRDEGAPIELVVPEVTTGVELETFLTADAESPNAARLFVNYLLGDGNALLSPDPESTISPLDPGTLPGGYVSPAPDVSADKDRISAIFG